MLAILRAEYEQLQAEHEQLKEQLRKKELAYAKLEEKMDHLLEQIRLAKHKQFGASSEKLCGDGMEQLSLLFNEAEVYAGEVKDEEPKGVLVSSHRRHKKHEYTLDNLPEDIPVEVVEHRLPESDLVCEVCGNILVEIGKDIRRRLKIYPARIVVLEDWYYTYACQRCNTEGTETPVTKAPKGANFLSGSFATPEAVAHLMTQKFVMGSPLYRQELEMKRQGISLSRQTMSNWILRAAEEYLAPVYRAMHAELLKREVLHADETELQVLHEPGKTPQSKSYMWLYRTSGDTDRPIVLYEYQPGRGQIHPKTFLDGFKGYLHTDGYAGYHNLPDDITIVGCWAHARRKFDEAMKSLPKGKAKGSSAAQGLAYCNLLFEIEQGLMELSPDMRYTQRLELSNNRAERSIKPFVIDRKNFLFANTPGGARGSAMIFTMIQTAIVNSLDPFRYLTWLFYTGSDMDLKQAENIQNLLPWNAPTECKAK